MGKKVHRPKEMVELEYDAICVVNQYSKEIREQCKNIGINLNKVIFLYNNYDIQDFNKDYDFIENVLGKKCALWIKERYHIVRGVEAYGDLFLNKGDFNKEYYDTDYVRIKTFELVVKEIRKKNIVGAVAELGVFRGEFAQYINYAFPDRKCYLFDSFEGFNGKEALKELKAGNCTNAFIEAYKDTDIGIVLNRMINAEQIIIKQGYFPESIEGLEEKFALVSLDVDFEESIYEGLRYFYPRLTSGGYLFIHDYNSCLLGVESAVDCYEKEYGQKLCKVPMCDANGTLILVKP